MKLLILGHLRIKPLQQERQFRLKMNTTQEWISVSEAAKISGYHPEHIRRLLREDKISAQKFSIVWQVDRDSLRAYIKSQEKGTKTDN